METYDVIIIGAGPAGLTAAIYTSRGNLKTLILSKNLGGQAAITSHVENYPGFSKISGASLIKKMERQVKRFGIEIFYEEITEIKEKNGTFIIKGAKEYKTKSLILAFGKTPRSLNVSGEKEFTGKGISYCVVCDAPLFRNKITAVVGGGNSALDAALLLSEIAKKVYLIHRRDEFRGFESSVEMLKKNKNIEFVLNSIVTKFNGEKFLKSVTVQNVKTNEDKNLEVDGAFMEIGSEVKTDLIKNLVKLDENNQIVINQNCETFYPNSNKIRPGIFAAGDVTSMPFKQIVTAAGDGAKAALQARNYLKGIKAMFYADWGKKIK